MVSTQRSTALHDEDSGIGLPSPQGERDQSALKPAAGEGEIESLHGAEHAGDARGIQPARTPIRLASRVCRSIRALPIVASLLPFAFGAGPSAGQEVFGPADLGTAPAGEMEALLEVTIFNIDVLTLTVRVGEEAAARLSAVADTFDEYDEALADSVSRIVLEAEDLWSRQVFERNVGYGRLIDAMEGSAEDAVMAGYISPAYASTFVASLPDLFGFLEEEGVREGDQIYMLVRGHTVRTAYRTEDGRILLDRSVTSEEARNGSIPTFFAPGSDFRRRLVESLLAALRPSE